MLFIIVHSRAFYAASVSEIPPSKRRDGALVHKRYHPPLTPYQRLLASPAVDETVKHRLRKQFAALDPVALLKAIRETQHELIAGSDRETQPAPSQARSAYLDGFATAWHNDFRAPKGRRRPLSVPFWLKPTGVAKRLVHVVTTFTAVHFL